MDTDCTWDEVDTTNGYQNYYNLQQKWPPHSVLYDDNAGTYEVLIFLPDTVYTGEHYKLITYNYDHWNDEVESHSQLISIIEHPTPDGLNLRDMFGAPNCVLEGPPGPRPRPVPSNCNFVNDALMTTVEIQDYESTLVRREDILYFQNDLYDNLWTNYSYSVIDPLGEVVRLNLT